MVVYYNRLKGIWISVDLVYWISGRLWEVVARVGSVGNSVLCKLDVGAQLSSLLLTLGLVPRKMVEFNPGLSKILLKQGLLV